MTGIDRPARGGFISQSILLISNFVSRVAVNHTGGNRGRGAGRIADVVSEARAILNGRGITGRFRLGAVARMILLVSAVALSVERTSWIFCAPAASVLAGSPAV